MQLLFFFTIIPQNIVQLGCYGCLPKGLSCLNVHSLKRGNTSCSRTYSVWHAGIQEALHWMNRLKNVDICCPGDLGNKVLWLGPEQSHLQNQFSGSELPNWSAALWSLREWVPQPLGWPELQWWLGDMCQFSLVIFSKCHDLKKGWEALL